MGLEIPRFGWNPERMVNVEDGDYLYHDDVKEIVDCLNDEITDLQLEYDNLLEKVGDLDVPEIRERAQDISKHLYLNATDPVRTFNDIKQLIEDLCE